MDYQEFLRNKVIVDPLTGHEPGDISPVLFDFQRDIVKWALRRGRAAIFADCGLGKTAMQLEWARHVIDETGGDVLILAPLAVSAQTAREAKKLLGMTVTICATGDDVQPGINITNYEKLHHFDVDQFAGVVLDESSIIKSHTSKTRDQLLASFSQTPYRLACTATPSPNDFMELGNHSEFLGVMTRSEMLSMFFIHDGGDTSKWRLKGHAEGEFWKWLCSWAVMVRRPSDLGYSNDGFSLPPINYHSHVIPAEKPTNGMLFAMPALDLVARRSARRETTESRCKKCADIVFSSLIGSFVINWQEKSGGKYNDMETRVQREQEEKIYGRQRVQREEEKSVCVFSGRQEEIYERVCFQEQGEIQEKRRETRGIQHKTQRKICPGCRLQGEDEGEGKRVPVEESRCEKSAKDKKVQFECARFQITDEKAEWIVCNLWVQRYLGQKLLPGNRSLSPVGEGEGTSLHELQYGAREVQGLSRFTREGNHIPDKQWIVWCDLNKEQDMLAYYFGPSCVSIYGSMSSSEKESLLLMWLDKKVPVLISKPSIFGFGLNLQQCSNVAFVGLSDSYESFYQATRRCWRFGQKLPVNVHVITSELEGAVVRNIQRKEADAQRMADQMVEYMSAISSAEIKGISRNRTIYRAERRMTLPPFLKEESCQQ